MDMLRHDHVTNHLEFVFLPDFFKDLQEQISARHGTEKWFSLVTTTGDVVEIATSVEPTQSFGHGGNFIRPSIVSVRRFVYPPFASTVSPVCIYDLAGRKGWGTHSVDGVSKKWVPPSADGASG